MTTHAFSLSSMRAASGGGFWDFDMSLAHPSTHLVKAVRYCGETNHLKTFSICRKHRYKYKSWRLFLESYGAIAPDYVT